MRFAGIILVIIGLYMAVIKPWFSTNFTGEELAIANIYDKSKLASKSRGWQVANVLLEREKSPAIVRIAVTRLPGQLQGNGKMKLLLRVAPISLSGETLGPVLNEAVTVNLDSSNSGATPDGAARITSISSSEFPINRTGNFKIGAFPVSSDKTRKGAPDLNIDRNITNIDVTILSGVEPVARSNAMLGFGLIVLGVVLLSISRRSRKSRYDNSPLGEPDLPPETLTKEKGSNSSPKAPSRNQQPEAEPEPKKRTTDIGRTIQWGRDAGKKR